jgi:hypothetical protein
VGENFEWGRTGSTPGSDVPNWSMVPPPGGPPPATADAGPSKPGGRGRTIRTVAIATVAAGSLALVGVGVASAQSSGSTTTTAPPTASPSTAAPGTAKPSGRPHGGPAGDLRGPGGPGGFGGAGSIHGEFVRPNGTGYQTVDTQIGVVQPGVSATSIEVKSADGFDKKYTVTTNTVVNSGRDGIGTVKAGDTVQIQAVVTGNTAEASSIVDRTTLGDIQGHWNPGRPAPAAPSTTTPPTTKP